jgi:O-antigen/teichoic acid export membrane protein
MTLKEKAINGVLWNATGSFTLIVSEFFIGIILARLLTPKEFGIIGTITIVLAISEVFVNGGFSQAIIRKQNCTQKDYSTAFFFNLIVGVIFFLILFFIAKPIGQFFNSPELKPMIQVLGFGLIINSFALIQQSILTKRIDFRLQTKISLIASIFSGTIAIVLASTGFGVWSLVIKSLLYNILTVIMLWIWNKWRPHLIFSLDSFKELFGFGSKLLLSGLIGTILNNINTIVIAKLFTPLMLGYFTRAEQFERLFSVRITSIANSVGYPVLATIQDDKVRLKKVFRDMFQNTIFIIVIIMAGLAATAKPLIVILIGNQWLPSVELVRLMCIVGVIAPLFSMNLNICNIVGRSDLYLKIQLTTQLLSIINVFLGYFIGLKALVFGIALNSFVGYLIVTFETNKILKYPFKEQLKDILPSYILAIIMGTAVYFVGYFSNLSYIKTLLIQIIFGIAIVIVIGQIFKLKEYLFCKAITIQTISKIYYKINGN